MSDFHISPARLTRFLSITMQIQHDHLPSRSIVLGSMSTATHPVKLVYHPSTIRSAEKVDLHASDGRK